LKEVLNEVCNYNTSGKHKSTYELKPEYRTAPKKPEPEEDKPANTANTSNTGFSFK